MAVIKYSTSEIYEKIQEMREISDQMQDLIERSEKLFMRMPEMWDSPISQQCAIEGLEQIRECAKLVDIMNKSADVCLSAVIEFEKIEESIANQIVAGFFQ